MAPTPGSGGMELCSGGGRELCTGGAGTERGFLRAGGLPLTGDGRSDPVPERGGGALEDAGWPLPGSSGDASGGSSGGMKGRVVSSAIPSLA